MDTKDKELWLKYAKTIKQIEAGEAFVVPTRIEPIRDVLFNHCAHPWELWYDLMLTLRVPSAIRRAATTLNKKVTDD